MPTDADTGLQGRHGPVLVDWPRSAGYFGGIGLATALGMIDPPLALFIAGIPFIKMLNRTQAPRATRFVAQLFEGAAKPLGGDGEGTIQLADGGRRLPRPVRLMADGSGHSPAHGPGRTGRRGSSDRPSRMTTPKPGTKTRP